MYSGSVDFPQEITRFWNLQDSQRCFSFCGRSILIIFSNDTFRRQQKQPSTWRPRGRIHLNRRRLLNRLASLTNDRNHVVGRRRRHETSATKSIHAFSSSVSPARSSLPAAAPQRTIGIRHVPRVSGYAVWNAVWNASKPSA